MLWTCICAPCPPLPISQPPPNLLLYTLLL